jgi:hypothetical protein
VPESEIFPQPLSIISFQSLIHSPNCLRWPVNQDGREGSRPGKFQNLRSVQIPQGEAWFVPVDGCEEEKRLVRRAQA